MIAIKLENLTVGMIVAEDIYNFQGLILLKQKTEISEKHIRMLKSWGVGEIFILGENMAPKEKCSDQFGDIREQMAKKMKEKFKNVSETPIMLEIQNIATDLLIQRRIKNEDQSKKL